MNLQAIRDQLKNHLDYSPELQAFNNQMDDLINDAYYNIWLDKRWTFATKTSLFKFYPDITGDRDHPTATGVVNANVEKGSRYVAFSATMDRLTSKWEGQVIEMGGYDYTISKVLTGAILLLVEPYHGDTNTDFTDWKIKYRWYDLPQDCIELLSLTNRDTPFANGGTKGISGKLYSLLARKEEELNLSMDVTATKPEAFIWSSSKFIPPAEKLDITNVTASTEGFVGFPRNTYLEVCWAFERDGQVGALSEPGTVTFGSQQNTTYSFDIEFMSWDDQPIVADTFEIKDRKPTQYEGFRKVIYWNANYDRTTGERLGLPNWKEFNVGGSFRASQSYLNRKFAEDTDASITVDSFNSIDPGNPRYVEYDGQYHRIRPYPRVDGWDEEIVRAVSATPGDLLADYLVFGELRYYYKPHMLTQKTDSPELPFDMHQLIVYKALQDVYLKIGLSNMSLIYQNKIATAIKQFEKRYVDHIDSVIVRNQFSFESRGINYNPNSLAKLN